LVDHPKFQSNEVYIGGDSYSGIPVPVIVQEIAQGTKLMCTAIPLCYYWFTVCWSF
jgi:hypothetical protein